MRQTTCAAIVLLGLLPAAAFAQPRPAADPLESRCVLQLPGMEQAASREDLALAVGRDTVVRFDLVRPPGLPAAARLPVVLFFNGGGGWNPPLRKWGIYRDWARLVAARGMVAVLADGRPGRAASDMASLVSHLRAQAPAFGLDMNRFGLWACSMHVREGLPFAMSDEHGVKAAVLYYGITDTAFVNPDRPVFAVRAGLDNAGILAAMGAWARRCIAEGAPLTWVDAPTLHHAFDAVDDDALSRSVVRQTLDFLERELSREGLAARAAYPHERAARRRHAARDWPGTIEAARAWLAADSAAAAPHQLLGDAHYQRREWAAAAEHYERAANRGWQRYTTLYNAACCRALLGEKQSACALLERAFATGAAVDRAAVRRDADLASLAGEPRFEALMRW